MSNGHLRKLGVHLLNTSIPQIYAVGGTTNHRDPCVATAVAQGAIAAVSIDEDWRNCN